MSESFTPGVPPKKPGQQYIIQMRNHPTMVGILNEVEDCFVIANVQAEIHKGKPYDHFYEGEFIEDGDITGWMELPE